MAKAEIRGNENCIKMDSNGEASSWPIDPVGTVMSASASLKVIAGALEGQHEHGQSNLLLLLAEQLSNAAERLDEENWEPTRLFN